MAEVFIPAPLRSLTAGQTTVTVRGAATVAEAVELLESRFPGVRERIIVDGSLRPGLQVTVDGASAELLQADGLFRGVQLPAGEHEVVFTFAPRSFQLGWMITAVGLMLLLLLGIALLIMQRLDSRRIER